MHRCKTDPPPPTSPPALCPDPPRHPCSAGVTSLGSPLLGLRGGRLHISGRLCLADIQSATASVAMRSLPVLALVCLLAAVVTPPQAAAIELEPEPRRKESRLLFNTAPRGSGLHQLMRTLVDMHNSLQSRLELSIELMDRLLDIQPRRAQDLDSIGDMLPLELGSGDIEG